MKIISAAYVSHYVEQRGGSFYKSDWLLTRTLRDILFPEYEFIIYTDQESRNFQYYDFSIFDKPNVKLVDFDLDSFPLLSKFEELRKKHVETGDVFGDRIVCIDRYAKIVHNKKNFLLNSITDDNETYVWLDAGLFGTSCANEWRDKMVEICHTKNFLDKVKEKAEQHDAFFITGPASMISYEIPQIYSKILPEGFEGFSVSGAMFGGKGHVLKKILADYEYFFSYFLDQERLQSEQDIFIGIIEKYKDIVYRYKYDHWGDLQKVFLKILDVYDESKYQHDKLYDL